MPEEPQEGAALAYDLVGNGVPLVFLPGLTFDRRSWEPVVERLSGSVRSITIDLPAHGGSSGPPGSVEEVAVRVHDLLDGLGCERPIVVGHSMSGGIASIYGAVYSTRGVVSVDNGPFILPFVQLVQQLEPVLRGPDFASAWQTFESDLGLERLQEPVRSRVLASHVVDQDVVVGYLDPLLQGDGGRLQAEIDALLPMINAPYLGVFGRPVAEQERERFALLPDVQLEEWLGGGHFVHLVDPDRFVARLNEFVDYCSNAESP